MVAVKLEHSDLAQHQGTIFKRLQSFRKEGQLCDVVLKSREGKEHRAHTAVLCAASEDLKNMLVGPFVEANQVQQREPVEMAASDAVVFALLEYLYGEQPQVELEDSLELLRLADAYNFPQLAAVIETGLLTSLDSAPVATVLKLLLQTQHLHDLKAACEKQVAAHFEMCVELADFLELSPGQLGRILRRRDLQVSREEVVVKGLFKWFKKSKDRGVCLGVLLQNIDFQSLSSKNLGRLQHLSTSMGPIGDDLQQEVVEALQFHKKRSAAAPPEDFCPKRLCLQNWSPDLGASSQGPQNVLQLGPGYSMCCHDGAIYCSTCNWQGSSILRWKPGDAESQVVAGRGARVNGVNDLGSTVDVSVSPEGVIFVADRNNRRLLNFENGTGNVVLSDVAVWSVFCSLTGAVFVLTQGGGAVERLVGATLQPVISSNDLPAELQFDARDLFVTKDELIYLSDWANSRVLRLNPSETELVAVGQAPNWQSSQLVGLFVTEDEKIYVADYGQRKVWTFHAGDAAWTEVLAFPAVVGPYDVVVEGTSLYASVGAGASVREYSLPPELQLE